MENIFNAIRNYNGTGAYPTSCGNFKIKNTRDLTTGYAKKGKGGGGERKSTKEGKRKGGRVGICKAIRNSCGNFKIKNTRDLTIGSERGGERERERIKISKKKKKKAEKILIEKMFRYDDSQPDKKAILPVSKSTQMITFFFENGGVATLR